MKEVKFFFINSFSFFNLLTQEESRMVSVRFAGIADMPAEQEQQQEVGEEQRYSSTDQSATEEAVEIMAVVRDDQQRTDSMMVQSPKARRAGYARQLATVGTKCPSRSSNRKLIKLVITRSRNDLDQVHHSQATSDNDILDVVHHSSRMSSILAMKELKHNANGASAEHPKFCFH